MLQGYHESYGRGTERRVGVERREYSLVTVARALRGQRTLGRRREDQVGAYVDRFGSGVPLLAIAIIILCCADALLTLSLIGSGVSEELNPVMRWAMQQCVYCFLTIKIGSTALALFVLLGLKNFYVFGSIRVSTILYGILSIYAMLTGYELLLHMLA